MFDKIVIVTKKTRVQELEQKFNQVAQAKFYIENSGQSFHIYQQAHDNYFRAIEEIRKLIPGDVKYQYIDRDFLPNFLFGEKDLVVTIGPDGLVINTAKYLTNQPILALNPDPERIDGIMIPFNLTDLKKSIVKVFDGKFATKSISMAKARLNDGQELFGVNDLFIGANSHVSFRYNLNYSGQSELQSSSGIIISTGAGSTGWFKSVVNGARGIWSKYNPMPENTESVSKTKKKSRKKDGNKKNGEIDTAFPWDSKYLYFSIREPFPSKVSGVKLVFGMIDASNPLTIESNMPQGGVIFSDGIQKDFLEFNSGKTAQISVAGKSAVLITGVV